GGQEGLQQQRIGVDAVGVPLAGAPDVLGEGVDLELPAGAHGLQGQPAPGGGIGRLRPGAVDGGDQTGGIGEGDQPTGFGALAGPVGVQDPVGGGVDGSGLAEHRVEDLGHVHGVVDQGAAAGQFDVGEPVAGRGQLAVV